MKTVGILGGMSIESTIDYIKLLNKYIKELAGSAHSPKIALRSVDFAKIEKLQHEDRWDELGSLLANEAKYIEKGGADFLIIATNTMHKILPQIEKNLSIPVLHIATPTTQEIIKDGNKKVALLGTKFTMQEDFYKARLVEASLEVITPSKKDQDEIHRVIYEELCKGVVLDSSISKFQNIISNLTNKGAQGVILGCTEIGMIVKEAPIKIYDTTSLHVRDAARLALES